MSLRIKTAEIAISLYLLACILFGIGTGYAAEVKSSNHTGFLVVAADRGFVGNEEIRDAFESFAAEHPAALVLVTDDRTRQTLQASLDHLYSQNIDRIVVLPLFISTAEPRYQLIHTLITEENKTIPAVFAHPYGESYFAVEALASQLRTMAAADRQHLLIVGYGTQEDKDRRAMYDDWQRIAKQASQGIKFQSINVLIIPERKEDESSKNYSDKVTKQLTHALSSKKSNQVIAFTLGPKHDNMMSLENRLQWYLPKNAKLSQSGIKTQQLTMWMQREANRNLPLETKNTGVILFAHGSDFHWNESLRTAVQPLMGRYKIEYAFSMADPATIERALRKLEQRGAQNAIIVSAYATSNSFRQEISYLTGLDIENPQEVSAIHNNGYGHHGQPSLPPARILTSLPVVWTGGYEDNPLFAQALFDRALALSEDPAKETIILTAHGAQDDQQNDKWLKNLENITHYMSSNGGQKFKAFQVGTWREDWPEKRKPWVKKIRAIVTEANKQGGTAIVIPARTTGTGPEKRFLESLKFELGEGFAPHPLFTQWVEEQIQQGVTQHKQLITN